MRETEFLIRQIAQGFWLVGSPVTPKCVDQTEGNVGLSDCRGHRIPERKEPEDFSEIQSISHFLPDVNNRDRLGKDSTEKVGTAEVDKEKVVITFQKLFPEGSMFKALIYTEYLSLTAEMTMMLASTDSRVSDMSMKTMKPPCKICAALFIENMMNLPSAFCRDISKTSNECKNCPVKGKIKQIFGMKVFSFQ